MVSADNVIEWLVTSGSRCSSPAELLAGYCERLREAEIPVDRSTLGAPLLHPIAQSSYVFWDIETGSSQRWFQWTADALETMRASPIYPVYTEGRSSRLLLANEEDRSRFPIGADLWEEGYFEYLALALSFSDGSWKVLTLATKNADGFSDQDRRDIDRTLPALALVFEGFIARNTARTLMETYVGKRAGLRVLDGEIARGDGSRIDAVIWFCDLRNFTALSEGRGEEELLAILNAYFELVTNAVESNGGEVLKFIGDAMLAIFPVDRNPEHAVKRAEDAALGALETHRETEAGRFAFGVALHPGEVFYGNIGGGARLDFTVIGAAVNTASRIESLAGDLGEPLLVSKAIVERSTRSWREIGAYDLKGVADPVTVFAPEA